MTLRREFTFVNVQVLSTLGVHTARGALLEKRMTNYLRTKGRFHPEKLREVILFLLSKRPMTEEELGTYLYFIDMDHYEKYETSITGCTYIKERNVPLDTSKMNR